MQRGQSCCFAIQWSNILQISGLCQKWCCSHIYRVGPILFEDFVTLPRHMDVKDLVRFLKDQTNNNNGTVLLSETEIVCVAIRKSQIEGILPLLEESM